MDEGYRARGQSAAVREITEEPDTLQGVLEDLSGGFDGLDLDCCSGAESEEELAVLEGVPNLETSLRTAAQRARKSSILKEYDDILSSTEVYDLCREITEITEGIPLLERDLVFFEIAEGITRNREFYDFKRGGYRRRDVVDAFNTAMNNALCGYRTSQARS
ncbi:MAG: hypothetical protein KJ574_01190 [Nanoarchaeota archaeon]|nr:hypothetical protein [Nanoarchaeota archaeon]